MKYYIEAELAISAEVDAPSTKEALEKLFAEIDSVPKMSVSTTNLFIKEA